VPDKVRPLIEGCHNKSAGQRQFSMKYSNCSDPVPDDIFSDEDFDDEDEDVDYSDSSPFLTSEQWVDLYTDGFGRTISDADPGL
jgi:hypothetical protein